MIVPDFGVSADDKAMVALKRAIENRGDYAVKVVDLPAVVRDEHAGEELTESKVIELGARKLEQFAEHGETALCPYCGCDTLIADSSGIKLTKELLSNLNKKYF